MIAVVVKLIAAATILSAFANGARILGVFPYPSHSHQVVFRALTTELAKRGHELVIFTTFPLNDPEIKNYTEVDLHFLNVEFKKKIDFFKTANQGGLWGFLRSVYEFGETITDGTLSHPEMQRIISPDSKEKFDLILVQCLYHDALYALSVRLNAPIIGMSSLPILAVHHHIFGNPLLSAYSPDSLLGYTENMSLYERMVNVYYSLRQIYEHRYITVPVQEKVVRKHFGDNMPPIQDMWKQISLLLVNSHPFFSYSRPNVPSIIHIGGCRSGGSKKSLPQDLKEILDKSASGFIYFSLGSNIKSSQLPAELRKTILATFAELPYTVLWKFETDELTVIPHNVVIRKWLPQQEILAHPNIVLFIYQGGLQSTEEAIDNGVPMIGFPVFSDQMSNLNKLEHIGGAKKLELAKIEKETFKQAIVEIIKNPSYKENIMKLRDLLRDLPHHPMENAIWWTEHVIRHKGAPHLYNRSRDMSWYSVELLDIVAFGLVSLILTLLVTFFVARTMFKTVAPHLRRVDSNSLANGKKVK